MCVLLFLFFLWMLGIRSLLARRSEGGDLFLLRCLRCLLKNGGDLFLLRCLRCQCLLKITKCLQLFLFFFYCTLIHALIAVSKCCLQERRLRFISWGWKYLMLVSLIVLKWVLLRNYVEVLLRNYVEVLLRKWGCYKLSQLILILIQNVEYILLWLDYIWIRGGHFTLLIFILEYVESRLIRSEALFYEIFVYYGIYFLFCLFYLIIYFFEFLSFIYG